MGSNSNRMVLLCMLILSMVSLPTSLARSQNYKKVLTKTIDEMKTQGKDYGGFTDFLKEAVEVVGPALQKGFNAVMDQLNKGSENSDKTEKKKKKKGEDYCFFCPPRDYGRLTYSRPPSPPPPSPMVIPQPRLG